MTLINLNILFINTFLVVLYFKKEKMKNEIYIGDNLEVMEDSSFINKYKEKIACIYLDPPYNTKQSTKSYNDNICSDKWAEFIEDRIEKSKKFLKDSGAIFISIDDNEYATLKIICDKIFGKENFVGTLITQQAQRSNAKHINTVHEYILCFAKNIKKLKPFKISRLDIPEDKKLITELQTKIKKLYKEEGEEKALTKLKSEIKRLCEENKITWLKNYSNIDKNGQIYFSVDLSTPGTPRKVDIPEINLHLEPLPTRNWASDKRFIELYHQNRLCFKDNRPYSMLYLEEATENLPSILKFFSRQGTNDLNHLGLHNIFDTPKPVELIKLLIRISTEKDDIIMDYFAGSGTTAQAVYELNKNEKRNNKYVLVQINEQINEKSTVYKACQNYNIEPFMKNILTHRIDTFLNLNNMEKDYEIKEL